MALKESAIRYKQKTNISRYQSTNLLKTWLLVLVCKKAQKEDKSEFATKSIGIIVMIIFISKYLELLMKTLLHSFFSLITWITKL